MDDPDFVEEFHRTFWNDEIPEADSTPDSMDPYINMELAIDQGEDQPSFGRVVKHMKDTSSGPIEQAPSNPMLDTQLYKVQFLDGEFMIVMANLIAENMLTQVDDNGYR